MNAQFLLYVFLLMTYYLLFILYVLQTMEIMLDKKQTRAVFLFEFKMGHKGAETTHNIYVLALELIMDIQCSVVSRSFGKETRALMNRSIVVGHCRLTVTN